MKKPLNKVALALWIVAILFVLIEIWTTVDMYRSMTQIHGDGDNVYLVGGSIQRIIQSTVGATAMLAGLGMLIELVDQIRWTIVRAAGKS